MSKNRNKNRNNMQNNSSINETEATITAEVDNISEDDIDSTENNVTENIPAVESEVENGDTEELAKDNGENQDSEAIQEEVHSDEVNTDEKIEDPEPDDGIIDIIDSPEDTDELSNDDISEEKTDTVDDGPEPVIGTGWWVQINQRELPDSIFNIYVDRLDKSGIRYKITGSGIFFAGPYNTKSDCIIARKNIIRRGLKGTIVEL